MTTRFRHSLSVAGVVASATAGAFASAFFPLAAFGSALYIGYFVGDQMASLNETRTLRAAVNLALAPYERLSPAAVVAVVAPSDAPRLPALPALPPRVIIRMATPEAQAIADAANQPLTTDELFSVLRQAIAYRGSTGLSQIDATAAHGAAGIERQSDDLTQE